MSLQALLGPHAALIMEAKSLDELKETLFSIFTSAAPIEVRTPLKINNRTNSAAVQIVNSGRDDSVGISIEDAAGHQTKVGIGLGSVGLIANQVVTDRKFAIDQNVIQQKYQGENVGSGYADTKGIWEANRFNLEFPKLSKRCSAYALAYATTVTLNYGLGGYQYTTLTGNLTATIDSTKMTTGQTMWWEVIDTSGSRVITFAVSGGGSLVWDGGTQPAALAATKGRVFSFTKNSAGNITGGVAYNSY